MLIDVLKENRVNAMKNKFELKKNLLGVLIGEATKVNKTPSDAEVITCIKKMVTIIDTKLLPILKENSDSWNKAISEKEILVDFLPKQMTSDEIETNIKDCVGRGLVDIGPIQKYFKENFAGLYNGADVSKKIKEVLA